jgi:hypothetical protein
MAGPSSGGESYLIHVAAAVLARLRGICTPTKVIRHTSTGAANPNENGVGVRVQSLDANLLAGSGIAWTLGESLIQPATRYNQYSDPCARAARNSLAVMSTPTNAATTVPFTSTCCNRPFEST